jgi:hypothetical protein
LASDKQLAGVGFWAPAKQLAGVGFWAPAKQLAGVGFWAPAKQLAGEIKRFAAAAFWPLCVAKNRFLPAI